MKEASPLKIVQAALEALDRGERIGVATVIRSPRGGPPPGTRLMVREGGVLGRLGDASLETALLKETREAIKRGSPTTFTYPTAEGDVEIFLDVMEGLPTLLIAGAGHIGNALARMGKLVGFRVAVVDDRPDFASKERFPEADQVIAGEFASSLAQFPIHNNTFVVIVTRGHRHDEDCLRQVLRSPAAYIGMIGSRRRVTTVLRHLQGEGFPPERLRQVYSPIGLDIGGETPEEIALAILAEIVKVRRGGSGVSLKLEEEHEG